VLGVFGAPLPVYREQIPFSQEEEEEEERETPAPAAAACQRKTA
jgi:hypothetical protein